MKRLFLGALITCSLLLTGFSLAGCNTFAGVGADTRETGDFVGGTPRHDAYHVDARDF